MLFSDLREVKAILEIDPDNTQEDIKLSLFLEQVSDWFEEWTGREFTLKLRTKAYPGTGTQRLNLDHRPVFPSVGTPNQIQVIIDENANFGQATGSFSPPSSGTLLTYGTEYTLRIDDSDNNSSKSGILIRIGNYWPKPAARQDGWLSPFVIPDTGSVQVTYYAGYTVDTLPATLRMACNTAIASVRYLMPLGVSLGSDSYEGRSIGTTMPKDMKSIVYQAVYPHLHLFRNWKF